MPTADDLVLSVVSHGQRELLLRLLGDLQQNVSTRFRLIITENVPEDPPLSAVGFSFPFEVVRNPRRRGFGENHNSALLRAGSGMFCVMNPDIRIPIDPVPELLRVAADPEIGVVSPAVTAEDLSPEDHAREFPSLLSLLAKAFGCSPRTAPPSEQSVYFPDWVAGMFMLFRAETLRSIGGFDERYFLYYEDVDLCARLRQEGLQVAVCATVSVVHEARRQSRKNLVFASWHLRSAIRFLASRPRIALGIRPRR